MISDWSIRIHCRLVSEKFSWDSFIRFSRVRYWKNENKHYEFLEEWSSSSREKHALLHQLVARIHPIIFEENWLNKLTSSSTLFIKYRTWKWLKFSQSVFRASNEDENFLLRSVYPRRRVESCHEFFFKISQDLVSFWCWQHIRSEEKFRITSFLISDYRIHKSVRKEEISSCDIDHRNISRILIEWMRGLIKVFDLIDLREIERISLWLSSLLRWIHFPWINFKIINNLVFVVSLSLHRLYALFFVHCTMPALILLASENE